MSEWLDLVGSFVIGGLIILIIINLNLSANTSATQNLYSNVTQRQVVSSVEVIEQDIYKIGYRVSNNAITKADSNEIIFQVDRDNNGVQDQIHYYLTGTSSMNNTYNPDDRLLWRKLNNETDETPFIVTKLNFSYQDSLGQMIEYNSLSDQLFRNKIKTIKVQIETQTGESVDGKYETIQWQKIIRPKNI